MFNRRFDILMSIGYWTGKIVKTIFFLCILFLAAWGFCDLFVFDYIERHKVVKEIPVNISYNQINTIPIKLKTPKEFDCLAKNIYFEARNQNYKAKLAVGYVTINRVLSKKYPNTICEVVKQGEKRGNKIIRNQCQFSWYCDGKRDKAPVNNTKKEIEAWMESMKSAEEILFSDPENPIGNAKHYHSVKVKPNWSKKNKVVYKIQQHVFYQLN